MPDGARPTISTHVLDIGTGMPAVGVPVTLWRLDVAAAPIRMSQVMTDGDGRVRDLLERPLVAGAYRLDFDVSADDEAFFTRMAVDFRVSDPTRSYHVPLLMAPYALSSYRGS